MLIRALARKKYASRSGLAASQALASSSAFLSCEERENCCPDVQTPLHSCYQLTALAHRSAFASSSLPSRSKFDARVPKARAWLEKLCAFFALTAMFAAKRGKSCRAAISFDKCYSQLEHGKWVSPASVHSKTDGCSTLMIFANRFISLFIEVNGRGDN